MSEKFSDILIVGTDLPGLIAGVFLAKRGRTVTLLNFDSEVGFAKKGIQPNLLTHLDSRLFKSILGRLSLSENELNILKKNELPFQVVLPQHRIDVHTHREQFLKELKREFGEESEAIKTLYLTLDELDKTLDHDKFQDLILPKTLKEKFKFSQFIKENHLDLTMEDWNKTLGVHDDISCFLNAQIKILSNLHSSEPYSLPLAKLLAGNNPTLFTIKGGLNQLQKIFMNKLEHYSGRVRNQVRIEKILMKGLKVRGVKLAGFEGDILCKYLLWNHAPHHIESVMPQTWLSKFLLRKIKKVKPSQARFSIQYEVDPEVIPVGMNSNVLLIQNPSAELKDENFLNIQFYYPQDNQKISKLSSQFSSQTKNSGRDLPKNLPKNLIVTYISDLANLEKSEDFFEDLHQKITAQLHELMPFSKGRLKLVFPKHESVQAGDDLLFSMHETDFELFKNNASQNLIYQVKPNKFQNLFPFPSRYFVKNLIFTSSELLAALGFEGSYLLGLKTTDLIWSFFEKNQNKAVKQRKLYND